MKAAQRYMAVLGPLLAVGWTAALLGGAPVFRVSLSPGEYLLIWPHSAFAAHRAVWAVIAILLAGAGVRWGGFFKTPESKSDSFARWGFILAPLWLLPLPALSAVFRDIGPAAWLANFLFFGTILLLAWTVARWLRVAGPVRIFCGPAGERKWLWTLFVVGAAAYGFGGNYVSRTAGEHLGDEGHYRIQQESLWADGDLDIYNNLNPPGAPKMADPARSHIAPNTRLPHWYNWHPIGLPLLAAPFGRWGVAGRHGVLGLIAGAGLAGLWALIRCGGVSRRAALLTTLVVGGSAYWAFYAFRFLPEMLGAVLLIWSFWAVSSQRTRPWGATVVACVTTAYLPFVHIRFLPLGLMAFGFFGLTGLGRAFKKEETWPRCIARMAVLTACQLSAIGLYFYVQSRMFTGSSVPVEETLLSNISSLWRIIADHRGTAPIFPLLFLAIPSAIFWPFRDAEHRMFAAGLALTFLAAWITSCSNDAWFGGSCVQGRYLLVAVPLLTPGAAWWLDRAAPARQVVFAFLGLISVAFLVMMLWWLPHIGRSFTAPLDTVAGHPLFGGIWEPYAGLMDFTASPFSRVLTNIFVAGLLVAFSALLTLRARVGWIVMVLAIAAGIGSHILRPRLTTCDSDAVADVLGRCDWTQARMVRTPPLPARSLWEVSSGGLPEYPRGHSFVLTTDPAVVADPFVYSQGRIPANDWAGRSYRWFTAVPPFRPKAGRRLLQIAGTADDNVRPIFVLKEGSRVIFEGPMDRQGNRVSSTLDFDLSGRKGHLYILLRLEGAGACKIDTLQWTPFSDSFLSGTGLTVDGTIRHVRGGS